MGLPGDHSYQWKERQLLVTVTAEGPACVLTIADLQVCIFAMLCCIPKQLA